MIPFSILVTDYQDSLPLSVTATLLEFVIAFFTIPLIVRLVFKRSGSLWMAVALHLANNYTSLVLVGTKGDALPSAAPLLIEVPSLLVVTVALLVQSAAIFLALNYLMKRAGR